MADEELPRQELGARVANIHYKISIYFAVRFHIDLIQVTLPLNATQ